MSKLALSQDQIDDINSFLDNELASCMDEDNSMMLNSFTNKSKSCKDSQREEFDIPASENILELQNKIDILEQRMMNYAGPDQDPKERRYHSSKKLTKQEKNKRELNFQNLLFKQSGRKIRNEKTGKKRRNSKSRTKKRGRKKKGGLNSSRRNSGKSRGAGKLDSSRSFLHPSGRQTDLEVLVVELQAKVEKFKSKLKLQRKKTRGLKKENDELKNVNKKIRLEMKKYKGLENHYQVLMDNFEESEKLRFEQQQIIDKMRIELKKSKKKKKEKDKKNLKKTRKKIHGGIKIKC